MRGWIAGSNAGVFEHNILLSRRFEIEEDGESGQRNNPHYIGGGRLAVFAIIVAARILESRPLLLVFRCDLVVEFRGILTGVRIVVEIRPDD